MWFSFVILSVVGLDSLQLHLDNFQFCVGVKFCVVSC